MIQAPRTATGMALAALEKMVASHGRERETFLLPGIRFLARQAGVSPVTMCKAVGVLKGQGRIVAVPGKGLLVPGAGERTSPPSGSLTRQEKWEMVRKQIAQEICNGTFPSQHALPSFKELSRRYHAGYHVLRKALAALSEDGIVALAGRKYVVPMPVSDKPYAEIVLIGAATDRGIVPPMALRDYQFLNAMEIESYRRSFRLVKVGYRDDRDAPAFYTHEGKTPGLSGGDFVLGYIVWPRNVHHLPGLVKAVTQMKKPVALLQEETFREPLFSGESWPGILRIIDMGHNKRIGFAAGRYLLAKGHAHVAYINPLFGRAWSDERGEGLQASFTAAGYDCGVEIVAPASETYRDYRAFLDAGMAPYRDGMLKQIEASTRDMFAPSMLHRHASVQAELETIINEKLFLDLLSPSFDRLIADRSVTAWVCANDEIARIAQDYLRLKRVAVPGRVAVMGFDDTADAYSEDITSYNFNIPSAASALVSYILNPSIYHRVKPEDPVVIEGIIIERASTRK